MTTEKLAELDALHAAMTPGEWRSNIQWLHGDDCSHTFIGPR